MQVTNVDIKSDDDFIEQEEIRKFNAKLKKVIENYEKQKDKQLYIIDHIQEFYDADKSKRR